VDTDIDHEEQEAGTKGVEKVAVMPIDSVDTLKI